MQFSDWKIVLFALVVSAMIFVTRYAAVRLLYSPNKYSLLDAMVSTAMGPRGLACAVLATIPLQRGLEGGQWLQDALFAIIPITIALTAVFVALSENQSLRIKMAKLFSKYSDAALQPTVPDVEK